MTLRLLLLTLIATSTAWAEDPSSLVFIFQKQKNPAELQSAAAKVGQYLSKEVGVPVKVQVPMDYSASVQALVSKKADFAYTSSLPFLLARKDGGASILLAEQRVDTFGKERTDYDSVFVVKQDSPLKSFENLVSSAKTLRFAFTSQTSTSGYLFPYARFVRAEALEPQQDPNKLFKSVSFAGSYTQALEQVLDGRADVCAVSYYTLEGPKAGNYLRDSKRAKLRILSRTPGVPTHVITARAGLSETLKTKVKKALLKLSKESPELLSDVYGTASFVEVDENKHVAATAEAVEYLGLPITGLVKKPHGSS